MFGSSGLKINGKVFAMLVKGDLVVKLPRESVDELIAGGSGVAFDPGHGRVMKEWVRVEPTQSPGLATPRRRSHGIRRPRLSLHAAGTAEGLGPMSLGLISCL